MREYLEEVIMFVAIGLIAILATILYVYLVWNFNYWKNKGVVGPKPIPLVGAFPQAFFQRKNMIYEVNEVYKYAICHSHVNISNLK